MRILGISGAFGHDAAAALVVDGIVVAACEEERYNRVKRSARHPAINATLSCLAQVGMNFEDIDLLAFGWDPSLMASDQRLAANRDAFLADYRWGGSQIPDAIYVPHHLAHAASSWYLAGIDNGAVLVVDGQGEDASITIFEGSPEGLLERVRYEIPASLGFFYAAVTRYLGFAPGSAGKVMGLSAYGRATHDFPELDFSAGAEGVSIPGPQGKPERMNWWLARFEELFGPSGHAGAHDLPAKHLQNAAASAQAALERSLSELVERATAITGSQSLVLSGGVALNCSANGRLRQSATLRDLYVYGAAHDAGTAVGAALHVAATSGEPLIRERGRNCFLGAEHPIGLTVDHARRLGLTVDSGPDVEVRAADLIHEGKVGGWYRGRSEYGPRALGGRSIVARADSTKVRDRVNKVKSRESWRPLAPALTASAADRLSLDHEYDFMIEAYWPSPDVILRSDGWFDGALHVDGSMRPLVVSESTHPFFALLAATQRRHGREVIINTSFNSEREPMVETPSDALRTFVSSDMDFLVLDQALLQKPI